MTTDRHRALASESRVRILTELRTTGQPRDARSVADAVGLHVNTVRAHLDTLVDAGLATRHPESRDRPGRPRIVYEARSEDVDDGESYRFLAAALSGYLRDTSDAPSADAEAAGRRWGQQVASAGDAARPSGADGALDDLDGVLQRLGFAPRRVAPGDGRVEIHLDRCPLLDLVHEYGEVVCGLHLGMLRGLLTAYDAPYTAAGLRPLVRPDLCIADLERRDDA